MGGAFSKLCGGREKGKRSNHDTTELRKDTADRNGLPTTNTAAKPPTPIPEMSGIQEWEVTEPWLKLTCALGEGPFWEESTNTLRFIDIEKQELHHVDLQAGPSSHKVVKKMDISMGCTADIEGNDKEFVFGGKFGYGVCNRETGDYKWIKKVWSEEEVKDGKADRMRGNDGAVDSQGRFWVGFMNDPLVTKIIDEGAVYRLDPDLTLHRPLSNITIPNGTTWSKTDDTMYFADSPSRTISRFDFDPKTGAVSNRRAFFTMPDTTYGKNAVPDGHCLDEDGNMWTAVHGGSVVLKINTEGEIVGEIKVPTSQPTCPCFVGTELVITSAGGTSGEGGKPIDEFAGCVFKINVGVRGLKRFKFKGGAQIEGGKVDGQVVGE